MSQDDLQPSSSPPRVSDPHVATQRPDSLATPPEQEATQPGVSEPGLSRIAFPPSSDDRMLSANVTSDRETERNLAVPAQRTRDRATLTVLSGFNAGQVFALDDTELIIGRGAEADVWAEDSAVSRKHARIVREGHSYFLEDLSSLNGTFIADRRVDRLELTTGDRLQLGPNVALRFAIVDDAEEQLQRRLYESSTRDALTRAFNRKYLSERLVAELAHARRHKTHLALLVLDIDRFKNTNDTYGHLAGDMVLRVVAAQLARMIRVDDMLARYGGEEFVVLVRATSHGDARRLADRMRIAIEGMTISAQEQPLKVTVSIGVASLGEMPAEAGPTELFAQADARLYRAKLNGRNLVVAEGECKE